MELDELHIRFLSFPNQAMIIMALLIISYKLISAEPTVDWFRAYNVPTIMEQYDNVMRGTSS